MQCARQPHESVKKPVPDEVQTTLAEAGQRIRGYYNKVRSFATSHETARICEMLSVMQAACHVRETRWFSRGVQFRYVFFVVSCVRAHQDVRSVVCVTEFQRWAYECECVEGVRLLLQTLIQTCDHSQNVNARKKVHSRAVLGLLLVTTFPCSWHQPLADLLDRAVDMLLF